MLGSGEVQLELHYIEVDWLCLTISGDWGLISLHPNTPNCGRSWCSLLGLGDESGLFVIVVEVCTLIGMLFNLFYLLSCHLSMLLPLQFECLLVLFDLSLEGVNTAEQAPDHVVDAHIPDPLV